MSTHANAIIEEQLDGFLRKLEEKLISDVLVYMGPMFYGADDGIRDAIERLDVHKPKLTVILETGGGYMQPVQRIADTLHKHYDFVQFLVPNHAMSAGTVLAMCGNAILMDYYSVLGPIDPQVERPSGDNVPCHGYLVQYERLIEKSRKGKITTAELQYLIEKFDPAELYSYEQEMNLSVTLLKEWLVKYKFEHWSITKTKGKTVTKRMKEQRAESIARCLNDSQRWHSHGRGISREVLERDVKLEIEDFGADPELSLQVKNYHTLVRDYMSKVSAAAITHTRGLYTPLRSYR
jgi:hypothetical protein